MRLIRKNTCCLKHVAAACSVVSKRSSWHDRHMTCRSWTLCKYDWCKLITSDPLQDEKPVRRCSNSLRYGENFADRTEIKPASYLREREKHRKKHDRNSQDPAPGRAATSERISGLQRSALRQCEL
jgi:hypothetical protein